MGSGNQVDPDILRVLPLGPRPLRVHPDVAVEVGIAGLVLQVALDEQLEVGALFPFGEGKGSVMVKERLQSRHVVS